MNAIMGGALILLSAAMIAFGVRAGYVPVSWPTYRVYWRPSMSMNCRR